MLSRRRDLLTGDVVVALFPHHEPPDHEQEGLRPTVVIGVPNTLGRPRFPAVFLVSLTTDRGQEWAARSPELYPRIPAGTGGLPQQSLALLDQTRAPMLVRVISQIGSLPTSVFQTIHDGLLRMFSGPGRTR